MHREKAVPYLGHLFGDRRLLRVIHPFILSPHCALPWPPALQAPSGLLTRGPTRGSQACENKVPHASRLKTTEFDFLTVLRAGSQNQGGSWACVPSEGSGEESLPFAGF